MCAGALAVAANSCTLPHRTTGGPEARQEIGRRADCFRNPGEFYEHHTGEKYTPYILRMMQGAD